MKRVTGIKDRSLVALSMLLCCFSLPQKVREPACFLLSEEGAVMSPIAAAHICVLG